MNEAFAQNLSTDQIKNKIEELCEHKVITELDLLFQVLRFRKEEFKYKIRNEMTAEYDPLDEIFEETN